MGKHAPLDGAQLSSEEMKKAQIIIDKHKRVSSRSSTDSSFSDKIRHNLKLNANLKPFWRAYGGMSFEKRKTMKIIVVYLDKGNLVEPNQSNWATPSIIV